MSVYSALSKACTDGKETKLLLRRSPQFSDLQRIVIRLYAWLLNAVLGHRSLIYLVTDKYLDELTTF